jgi:hypothetical protein
MLSCDRQSNWIFLNFFRCANQIKFPALDLQTDSWICVQPFTTIISIELWKGLNRKWIKREWISPNLVHSAFSKNLAIKIGFFYLPRPKFCRYKLEIQFIYSVSVFASTVKFWYINSYPLMDYNQTNFLPSPSPKFRVADEVEPQRDVTISSSNMKPVKWV